MSPWHDAYDHLLTNTLQTHAGAAEPLGHMSIQSIRLGSAQARNLPQQVADTPFIVDPNVPPWLAVMKWSSSDSFGVPRFTFIDMRSMPQSGDMGTMIDDLRRHGAMPAP